MDADETGWVSTKDATRILGITLPTLYRLIDAGQLPAYKFGRVIRLRRPEIDAFIQASRIPPGTLKHLYSRPPEAGSEHTDDADEHPDEDEDQ